MILLPLVALFLSIGMTTGAFWSSNSGNHKKVLLTDVSTLTLRQGEMTTGRRSAPVPQLSCVGGCNYVQLETVQCTNKGSDGVGWRVVYLTNVQWKCDADMSSYYQFGRIEVVCEGYDYPDDPYVLGGSCGLEYTIRLTEEGKKKHQSNQGYGNYDSYNSYDTYGSDGYASSSSGFSWMTLIVVGVLIFLCVSSCNNQNQNNGYDGGHGGNAGPGGPGGPGAPGGGPGGPGCGPSQPQQQQGPGFWSGMAGGGLLGYLLGGGNRGGYYNGYGYQRHRPYGGGGMRFGGGGGMRMGGGGGGGVRQAAGFGGTRRR